VHPNRRLAIPGIAILVATILPAAGGLAPRSLARFSDGAAPTVSVGTDTLDPPTALAATGGLTAALSWIATVDTYASGYDVLRGTVSGGPYSVVASVSPRTVVTTSDTPATSGTYYYVLRSVFQSWTSILSNQASAVISSGSTGFKPCSGAGADNAPDTGGDNNGYESTPANACAVDGAVAGDINTGTNTATTCTDAGKDRHRWWNFGLGVPVAASAILGIQVQLTVAKGNNGSNAWVCVQLSPDGGTTWTTPKQTAALTTTSTAYTLGATNDTWGRAWIGSELSNANFRIRLIDVTDKANQDVTLDGLAAQVTYTP
jgi:hypothetical protein